MASALRTSEAGLKLIMAYEGFRSHSSRLPDGRWVIGYGHMRAAREGLKVSQPEAAAILREFDLPPVEEAILDLVLVPLNQNEFDALVSFAFNIGTDQLESSDVLSLLNSGDRMGAARALEKWCKARVGARSMVVDPLVRRRADEKALFLKAVGTVPLAASSRFRPMAADLPDEAESRGRAFVIREDEATAQQPEPSPDETATEAAARNVKERLTRILGEYEAGMPTAQDAAAAPDAEAEADGEDESVETIRAAISALVAEDEPAPEDIADLDEPGLTSDLDADAFDIETGNFRIDTPRAPRKGLVYIDDVSEVEIPPADPDLRRTGDAGTAAEMAVFAIIALLGALVFLSGGAFELGWFGVNLHGGDRLGYLPPFLMLTGALVFIVMSYYWARAVLSRR